MSTPDILSSAKTVLFSSLPDGVDEAAVAKIVALAVQLGAAVKGVAEGAKVDPKAVALESLQLVLQEVGGEAGAAWVEKIQGALKMASQAEAVVEEVSEAASGCLAWLFSLRKMKPEAAVAAVATAPAAVAAVAPVAAAVAVVAAPEPAAPPAAAPTPSQLSIPESATPAPPPKEAETSPAQAAETVPNPEPAAPAAPEQNPPIVVSFQ